MTKTPPKSPYRGRFKTPVRFEAERANALAALDEFSPEVREHLAVAPVAVPAPRGPILQPLATASAPQPLRVALKVPRDVRPMTWLGLAALVIAAAVAWTAARMFTGSSVEPIILASSRVALSPLDSAAGVTSRPPSVRASARRNAARTQASPPPAPAAAPRAVARAAAPPPAPVKAAPARAQEAAPAQTGFFGSLAVEASPAGARVFINGRLAGTAPVEVRDLAAGSRVVRIEADGYQPWSAAIRIVADQQARISVNLHQAR